MKSLWKAGAVWVVVIGLAACAPTAEEPLDQVGDQAGDPVEDQVEAIGQDAAPAPAPRQAALPPPAPRQAAAPPAPAQSVAPRAPAPRVFEVPEGTRLSFTLIDSLSTETNQPGDTFEASLSDALIVDGVTVIPRNTLARGRVLAVDEPGRVQGLARIELAMTEIRLGGQTVVIDTVPFVQQAESTRGEDATKIGVGAGIGAVIGGILGGGGGAAKGAAVGGGAGTGVVLATRGDQIVYPSETKLEFTLGQSVRITEGGSS